MDNISKNEKQSRNRINCSQVMNEQAHKQTNKHIVRCMLYRSIIFSLNIRKTTTIYYSSKLLFCQYLKIFQVLISQSVFSIHSVEFYQLVSNITKRAICASKN